MDSSVTRLHSLPFDVKGQPDTTIFKMTSPNHSSHNGCKSSRLFRLSAMGHRKYLHYSILFDTIGYYTCKNELTGIGTRPVNIMAESVNYAESQ